MKIKNKEEFLKKQEDKLNSYLKGFLSNVAEEMVEGDNPTPVDTGFTVGSFFSSTTAAASNEGRESTVSEMKVQFSEEVKQYSLNNERIYLANSSPYAHKIKISGTNQLNPYFISVRGKLDEFSDKSARENE